MSAPTQDELARAAEFGEAVALLSELHTLIQQGRTSEAIQRIYRAFEREYEARCKNTVVIPSRRTGKTYAIALKRVQAFMNGSTVHCAYCSVMPNDAVSALREDLKTLLGDSK